MKQKKKLANLIMVAVITVIVAAGILFVGQYRGWFTHGGDAASPAACAVRDKGIVDLTRDGIASHMADSALLRNGDRLSANKDAQATVQAGNSYLILGENAVISIDQADADHFAATVLSGEVFVSADDAISVQFGERAVAVKDSTAVISVRTGSESIGVLSGDVAVSEKTIAAGQTAAFAANSDPTYTALSAASLSDFLIQCALASDKTLCFTDEALTQVLTDRQAQKNTSAEKSGDPASTDSKTPFDTAGNSTQGGTSSGTPSAKPNNSNTGTSADTPAKDDTPASLTCTIAIYCDTILDNMENLDAGKDSYVPSNGVILGTTTVTFTEGETVFDVLKRACDQNGIQLEYSYTPLYESYYVEGINYLYEFDCGSESGWMYKVNGWFPNYGCSEYTLSQGDAIVWCYTCNGLGADVGGSVY